MNNFKRGCLIENYRNQTPEVFHHAYLECESIHFHFSCMHFLALWTNKRSLFSRALISVHEVLLLILQVLINVKFRCLCNILVLPLNFSVFSNGFPFPVLNTFSYSSMCQKSFFIVSSHFWVDAKTSLHLFQKQLHRYMSVSGSWFIALTVIAFQVDGQDVKFFYRITRIFSSYHYY